VTPQPPALAVRILRALLDARDEEIIPSDMLEEFRDRAANLGLQDARKWYLRQLFGFLISAPWFAYCLRTAVAWFAAFLAAEAVAVTLPSYAPFPAVAVFLLSIPAASFYVANRTGTIRAGMATALLSCAAMLCAAAWFIAALQLRHPPTDGWSVRLGTGILFSAACAFAGKASREGPEAVRLVG
jgi:hypothetical protein